MERISVEIERRDVADALHASAEAAGRSVEAELAALVEHTYAPTTSDAASKDGNWVEELVTLANGADLRIPQSRTFVRYAPAYPEGMEPLPGEPFVDHIIRISRPGFDLEIERDRTPNEGPDL